MTSLVLYNAFAVRGISDVTGCCITSCVLPLQALATSLVQVGRSRGVRSTGVLFIYWTLHVVCASLILRSLVIEHREEVRTSSSIAKRCVRHRASQRCAYVIEHREEVRTSSNIAKWCVRKDVHTLSAYQTSQGQKVCVYMASLFIISLLTGH